jgi:ABC-type proline/glycine betaine transport system ATPase subunit
VDGAMDGLEYSMLLENISRKMEIVKGNGIFETEEFGKLEEKDLDELKDTYSLLVERYVSTNRNDVIEECFFNLKLEGIYTNNEKLADELIEKANVALASDDYEELFGIVNVLYEIDERD